MMLLLIPTLLAVVGTMSMAAAVVHERRMQRNRQPGVSYAQVTLRRDGAWKRADLFTPTGLAHQRKASRHGVIGLALWLSALGVWITLRALEQRQ